MLFTAVVSFFAPLKSFQLKWLIDSKSKQEALGYMGLVFLITFTSWFFERLSRRSFTKLACGAVEQVRGQVMERVLRRPVSQYQREGDAAYLSLLTTDLRTLYDDYYMSIFNIVFWGGIMLCALGMYLYISPVMLAAILLVTVPPLVLPRKMNERLKAARDAFSLQMAGYTQQLKELLGGFEVIRGFLREDAYAARHRDAARQARTSELGYQQSLNAMVVNTSLISNLIFPIVMLVGLFLAFRWPSDDRHRLHRRQHGEFRHHALQPDRSVLGQGQVLQRHPPAVRRRHIRPGRNAQRSAHRQA